MNRKYFHETVLIDEVRKVAKENLAHLKRQIETKNEAIDATLGFGGHTIELLKLGYFVYGIDIDKKSLEFAKENIMKACPVFEKDSQKPYKLILSDFSQILAIARKEKIKNCKLILADLGTNTYQLTSLNRGFSFENPEDDLDMRMSEEANNAKASDVLNLASISDLKSIFSVTLPKTIAYRIARKVQHSRKSKKFDKVKDFLSVIKEARMPNFRWHNNATLPFLALRIEVNKELEKLESFLDDSVKLLSGQGVLMVISFHSGEDKIVKNKFKKLEKNKLGFVTTKKPTVPGEIEIKKNKSARSAKMRIFKKF